MVLEQDKPQASQAQAVLDEQQYQKDLAQYNQDLEKYNKEKEEYDKQQKKIADAQAAEQARIAEEKRLAKEKDDKRAAQFAAVEKTYQEAIANAPPYARGSPGRGYSNKGYHNYMRSANAARQEAISSIRL